MRKQIFGMVALLALALTGAACALSDRATATGAEIAETAEDASRQPTAAAPGVDLTGTYAVTGAGLDGKPYRGEMVVTRREDVYRMSWRVGEEHYDGVGVQSGNAVAAAYTTGKDGSGCGAVVYEIGADGALDGVWGEWGVDQSGTERATPSGVFEGSTGVFNVAGTNPDGTTYKGKLTAAKGRNDVFQFAWETGTKYVGTGVKMGEYLAAGSGAKQCGFVIYEVKDGNLEGKWGVPGTTALGTEQAVRKKPAGE